MGPPDSHGVSRAPRYSGCRCASDGFVYAAFMLSGRTFQTVPLTVVLAVSRPYNPHAAGTAWVWAVPRSLATTGGITFCFLFLRVLRCFSSPGSPPAMAGWQSVRLPGCPIRTSGGQRLPAPHPGFSQLAASFIAFQSPGIRRAPFPSFAAGN